MLTGLTSAEIRGWWLPPLPDDVPVFVTSQECGNNAVRPGLKVSRPRTDAGAEELLGLRVATVSETILACCRVLNLLDAVTFTECAVHARTERLRAGKEGVSTSRSRWSRIN